MDQLLKDLKLSLRLLAKTPGFSLAAITVLSLGIGLNTGTFSVLHALGFSARPFPEPDRVVQLYSHDKRQPNRYRDFSYPAYKEIAQRSDLFQGVAAQNLTVAGVKETHEAETRRVFSAMVSSNFFQVLGTRPENGRAFTSDEERPGSGVPVVIVGHNLWKRNGADHDLVGKTIKVNERPFTVVASLPKASRER